MACRPCSGVRVRCNAYHFARYCPPIAASRAFASHRNAAPFARLPQGEYDPEATERENDRNIADVGDRVSLLKSITQGIQDEVKTQNGVLDGMVVPRSAPLRGTANTTPHGSAAARGWHKGADIRGVVHVQGIDMSGTKDMLSGTVGRLTKASTENRTAHASGTLLYQACRAMVRRAAFHEGRERAAVSASQRYVSASRHSSDTNRYGIFRLSSWRLNPGLFRLSSGGAAGTSLECRRESFLPAVRLILLHGTATR